jgi:cell division protein FtsW
MSERWLAQVRRRRGQPMLKLSAVPQSAQPAHLGAARRPVRRLLRNAAARIGLQNTLLRLESMPSDTVLVATLIILTGSGLAVLLSASYFYGERVFDDPLRFFRRQVLWVAVGVAAAAVAAAVKLRHVRLAVPLLLAVSLPLVVLTFVPGVGLRALGAQRWILVGGLSFEPSELAKLALVLYLAHILDRKGDQTPGSAALGGRYGQTLRVILPPMLIVALFASLVYLQNDFSTPIFLVFLSMAMLWIAGVRLGLFAALTVIGTPLALMALLSKEHRVLRLIAFLEPTADPGGSGYQVLAARDALAHGGIWGTGIGRGRMKLGPLPEAHSDFIFAVAGEELGLVGVILILGLFAILAWRGYLIVRHHPDRFARYLAFGLTTSIVAQAFLNLAVVSSLVPATGLPLPFFSSGGSALLTTFTMCGLLVGLSRQRSATAAAPIGVQRLVHPTGARQL